MTLPVIAEALDWAQQGMATGASDRNWTGYGARGRASSGDDWQRKLLTDPQTSGGLLVACAPEAETAVLAGVPEARLRRSARDRPAGRRTAAIA